MNNTTQFCEKCGSEIKEKYASGRFCSKKCAYSRTFTQGTRNKISQSLMSNRNGWTNKEKSAKERSRRHEEFLARKVSIREDGKIILLDITNGELERYRKEHPVCEICGNVCKTGRKLTIDHNHKTGKFRGLLCTGCNRKLGSYESIKEKAEDYLRRSSIKAITTVL